LTEELGSELPEPGNYFLFWLVSMVCMCVTCCQSFWIRAVHVVLDSTCVVGGILAVAGLVQVEWIQVQVGVLEALDLWQQRSHCEWHIGWLGPVLCIQSNLSKTKNKNRNRNNI
jgi:hypothetical protein